MSWTEDAGREARDALRSERELTKFKELSECFLFWFSVCRAPPRNLRLEDMGALYSCMPDFCTSLEEELKEEDLLDFFKKCIKYEDAKSRFDAQHQSKLLGQLRDKICEFFDLKHYDDMGNCERFQFMCAVVYFHHEVKGREHFLPGPATGMISPLEVQAAEPSIKSAPMIGKKRVSPEQPGELKQLTIDEQMADPRCLLKSANDAQPLKKREAKEEEKFQPMCKAVTDGGPVGWQDELAKKEEAPAPAPLVPVSLAPVPLPPARMFIGVPEEMSSQNMVSMPFQLLYESGRVVFVFRYRTMHKFNVNRAFERQGIKFGRECKPMFRYSGTWVTNAEEVTFKYATAAQITKETGADLSDLTKSLQNKVSGSCAAVVVKRGFKEIKSVMLKESVGVSNLIKGTANTIKKQLEEDKEDLKKYFKDEVTELMSEQISKAKDEVVDEVRALGKKVECLEKGMKDDRLELMEVIQSERDAHAEHNNKVLQAVESANQRGPATHEAFSFSGQEDAFS